MDELRGFNDEKLWRKMFMDDDEFENLLKDLGLLHRRRLCCDKEMNVCAPKAGENWGHWRCSRCRKTKGYLTGTFFAGTHLSLKDVFRLSFYWCFQQYTVELIRFNFE